MREYSLTRRIVTAVLAVELLCAGGVSAVSLLHEYRSRMHAFDVMLRGRSDSLLGAIQDAEDPDDNVVVDPSELRLPPEDAYAVYNQDGSRLGGANGPEGSLTERVRDGYRSTTSGGHAFRVLQRQALRIIDREENGGVGLKRPVTIVYAAPTTRMWHEVFEAAGYDVLGSVAVVLGTTVLLVLFVRRLLRPINDLADSAKGVSASLAFNAAPSALEITELKPLVTALDNAIDRLRGALQVQQQFVGDAAHELKTAVAVVRSSIQVLNLKQRSLAEYNQGLEGILADNERVEELVARMLELARYEEGTHPVIAPVNLALAAGRALESLVNYAAAHGVLVRSSFVEDVWVQFSSEAAYTLITNLVVNAVQHSPRNAEVLVRVRRAETLSREATLEVQDFGAGIAESSLPHVFERFYRQDKSRSRETGGAGLGLAICKSLVEAAGGSISIESVEGKGTVVRASLLLA